MTKELRAMVTEERKTSPEARLTRVLELARTQAQRIHGKLAKFHARYNTERPHWALVPEDGGDPLTPAEVYAQGLTVKLPRWQQWAIAARKKRKNCGRSTPGRSPSVFRREPPAPLGCGGASATSYSRAHSRRAADLAGAGYVLAGITPTKPGPEIPLEPRAKTVPAARKGADQGQAAPAELSRALDYHDPQKQGDSVSSAWGDRGVRQSCHCIIPDLSRFLEK